MINYCKTGLKLSSWFTINIPIVNETYTPEFMSNNGTYFFGDKARSKKIRKIYHQYVLDTECSKALKKLNAIRSQLMVPNLKPLSVICDGINLDM